MRGPDKIVAKSGVRVYVAVAPSIPASPTNDATLVISPGQCDISGIVHVVQEASDTVVRGITPPS